MTNGEVFRQTFTRIKGLSTIRRLPRINKIRLGIKKISQKTGKEYPVETDYFVCPSEVMHFYGENPKELHIMFPLNDPESLFPQAYKWYGSSAGLKCKGDGITALRLNEETGEMEERECPCDLLEQGKCNQRASLVFMLPDVRISGVYQIDLSSYHSIVDINSGLDYALSLLGGRIAMVPFILKRVPRETHNEGKKQIHYTLQLELDINLKEAKRIRDGENVFAWQNKRYEIEPPAQDINPALEKKEDGAIIEEEEEKEIKEVSEKNPENQKQNSKDLPEKEPITALIYKTALEKGHKNWEDILYFAFKTNVYSAEEPMSVEEFQKRLVNDEKRANLLLQNIKLITNKNGKS
jgi:hypothetical protein